jgi:hypothetical protein
LLAYPYQEVERETCEVEQACQTLEKKAARQLNRKTESPGGMLQRNPHPSE